MKAEDYHRWWMASGIGLGHPLNDANFVEMQEQLSLAGRYIATLLHSIFLEETPTSKNYFIGNTEAARALRWAEAADAVGADKLAAALREEARLDYDPDKAPLFAPLRSYPNVESHGELRELVSAYAKTNQETLASDVAKHGDRRGEFPVDPKKFHNAWLRLVDKKHDRQRAAEFKVQHAEQREALQAKVSKLETLLEKEVMPQVAEQIIGELSDTWQSQQLSHDLTFADAADAWLSQLGELIRRYPASFPKRMRPFDFHAKSDAALEKLQVCLRQDDVEWLSNLGSIETLLLDEIPGDKRGKRYLVHITYRPLEQLKFQWGTAHLELDLGDIAAHSPLTDEFRSFVGRVINEASSREKQLSDDLVADYFDRFHTSTVDDPFALYDDDVTAEQLLNDVEGLRIQIDRYDECVVAQAWFSVPWDEEHGVEVRISLD